MDQNLAERTRTITREALRLPPGERERFLDETVAGDQTLLAAVRTQIAEDVPKTFPLIPGFEIDKLLDEGGMGYVYRAKQVGEGFERQVALKVVKTALATKGMLQRFRAERQFLASLDHPNIARMLDAATTPEGVPYLAMEFVEGVRIDRYSDAHELGIDDRLRLFLTVCDAVQYAHQHLIVHRDIKPSNIMVNSDGIPKLLDFGIAKVMSEEQPREQLSVTAAEGVPLTPMYASPEQVRGEPVTTSTDIYSLGILLYELLTGTLPYEFKSMTAAGIERTICETEPARPSEAKLGEQLRAQQTEDRLKKRLRGELDVILLMALRKEPKRRYASVFQFSDDLRRHLSGMPVTAHKDTMDYRARKFVRRHRAGVIAAAMAVMSLIFATAVSTHFAKVAQEEKVVAERRFAETRDLARFFITDLDDAIRAGETKARGEMVAKGLDYLKRLSAEAAGDTGLQQEAINGYIKMGDVQGNPFGPNLGQVGGARESYRMALARASQYAQEGRNAALFEKEISLARRKLADLDAVGGKPAEALRQYQAVLNSFTGLDLADLLNKMGWVQTQLGENRGALATFRRAEKIAGEQLQADPKNAEARNVLARSAERIGTTLSQLGDGKGAVENLRAALAIQQEVAESDPTSSQGRRRVWSASMLLGDVLQTVDGKAEAEAMYRKAQAIAEGLSGADKANRQYRVDLFTTFGRLSDLLAAQPARKTEARALTASALETLRPVVNSPGASNTEIEQYAWLLLTTPFDGLRNAAAALPLVEKASEKRGGQDPRVLDMLALAHAGVGNRQKAVEIERKALSLLPPDQGERSPMRKELEANLRRFEKSAAATSK